MHSAKAGRADQMNDLFLKIFNMSMTAVLLILAVILLRVLFKKAPKWISCILWALVAVRLLCPISFESPMSLLPSAEPVKTSAEDSAPYLDSGLILIDDVANEMLGHNEVKKTAETVPAANASQGPSRLTLVVSIACGIWIAGVMGFTVYGIVSYLKLKKTVAASVKIGEGVLECDETDRPFILGVINPVIYLPSGLDGKMKEYVLEHEKAHLERHDHWWKPLGFVLLALHWFNPLCWVAYVLFGRDIELACDERAVRDMNKLDKAGYSQTLLDLGRPGNVISACPVAFAEIGVKERVKSILNYKKPAIWMIVTGLGCCVAVSGCFLTNPSSDKEQGKAAAPLNAADAAQEDLYRFKMTDDEGKIVTEYKNGAVVELNNGKDKTVEFKEEKTFVVTEDDQTDNEQKVKAYDVIFEGDIDGDGTKDRIEFEPWGEYGAGEWMLIFDDEQIYSANTDTAVDFTVYYADVDNDGAQEIVLGIDPHANSLPYMKFLVLKKDGDVWKSLQNSDEFGMKDENGDPNNSFPIRVRVGEDLKSGEITIDGTEEKITFDLSKHYKKLLKTEKGNDIGDAAEKFLNGEYKAGDVIGGPADWGIWDIKAARLDGKDCLIAHQGLCGSEAGKFDFYGTIDIYFNYTEDGKINLIKTDFIPG